MKMMARAFTFPIPLYDCIAHVSTEYSCLRDRIWHGKSKNSAANQTLRNIAAWHLPFSSAP